MSKRIDFAKRYIIPIMLDLSRVGAICFDFDGTLARFMGDFMQLSEAYFSALALSADMFETCLSAFNNEQRKEGVSTVPNILKTMLSELGLETSANIDSVANTMTATYCAQMQLLSGAKELLKSLDLPLILITNGPSDMQRAAIKKVGIETYFKSIIVSGDANVAVRKPNPHIFEIACERLGAKPDKILMIGDNLEADVMGAINYGMQAVHINPKQIENANVVSVSGLAELSGLLASGNLIN